MQISSIGIGVAKQVFQVRAADAAAISEVAIRPTMRFVALRSAEQQSGTSEVDAVLALSGDTA